MILPVVTEKRAYNMTEEDIVHLSKYGNVKSQWSEADVMSNIVRDPILIGVTR